MKDLFQLIKHKNKEPKKLILSHLLHPLLEMLHLHVTSPKTNLLTSHSWDYAFTIHKKTKISKITKKK